MESKNKLNLFLIFFKIGACTIGGGYVMLPILQHELIKKRDWISDDELLDYFAIGQATPGIIAVNTATFVGYKIAGFLGALIASFAMVLPSLIIISIIAAFFSHFGDLILVQKALLGIRIAVSIVLIFTVIKLFKKSVKSKSAIVLALFGLFGVALFKLSPIIIISSVIFMAVFMAMIKAKKIV